MQRPPTEDKQKVVKGRNDGVNRGFAPPDGSLKQKACTAKTVQARISNWFGGL